MSRRRSSPPFSAEHGFTLIELLVAASIGTLIMGTVVNMLLSTTRYRREIETRLEVHQGLTAAIDTLTRDIRLAGACMPTTGRFIPLEGLDAVGTGEPAPNHDRITSRVGIVDSAGGCIRTGLREAELAGTTELRVASSTGFAPGMMIYVLGTATSEYAKIRAIQDFADEPSTDTLELDRPLTQPYPTGSGVYALEERRYEIWVDPLTGSSTLRLAIDEGQARAIALGIRSIDVQYRLRENCPACTVVPLPADDAQWRRVTDVVIDVSASLRSPLTGNLYSVSEKIRVKPRNLVPSA